LLAERCACRNGCGETAAKMGRGKVRAGGGAVVVVAMVYSYMLWAWLRMRPEIGDVVVLEILELELDGARVKLKVSGAWGSSTTTTSAIGSLMNVEES
jgi:hypothetical protein